MAPVPSLRTLYCKPDSVVMKSSSAVAAAAAWTRVGGRTVANAAADPTKSRRVAILNAKADPTRNPVVTRTRLSLDRCILVVVLAAFQIVDVRFVWIGEIAKDPTKR